MVERLRVGERVRVSEGDTDDGWENNWTGTIVTVDSDDLDVTYQVVKDGTTGAWWQSTSRVTLEAAGITLTPEKAVEVREALEALGWNKDDLGPLAQAVKPARVIKATITLPDDDQVRYARADFVTAVEGWNGTIEFED